MFDLTISLGNLLTIVAFLGGGIGFAYSIKSDTKLTDLKYTMLTATMDDFKIDMGKLTEVVTQQALASKRMDYAEERQADYRREQIAQGLRLDDVTKRVNLYADTPIYQRRDTDGRRVE